MKKPLAGLEKNTLRDMGNKTAYKGFDKDFKCGDFQFEVGKEYVQEGEIIPCINGFHACENPLDVLDYYSDIDGKYCIVEQGDEIKTEGNKIVSSKIKIKTEIGFVGLFKAGIEWIKEKTTINLKQQELLSGYYAQIGSSGDDAQIASSCKNSVICCAGHNSMAKAKIGSWITLSEWETVNNEYKPICVKTEYVDGERIKEDTWYKLINGEFIEQDGNQG